MTKESENMLSTIGETKIHESDIRNSEEEMVVVENQSDFVVQNSPKPSHDTNNMPQRDEDVEGSEKKGEANEEFQATLATKDIQEKTDKGTEKATPNTNKVQSIQEREQGIEVGEKNKGTYLSNVISIDMALFGR
ncbi:hypothetical protein GOP47_0018437 [Adiantum capillus-veneris]|uniref:Uncharacterized protein n=1 Tax=Adiantum capillus-veneris TaxID=13818 RepID=A0A9D4Z856_ADICA|nr:hypothetical protein GOP47_0018437 [Adiantum capillus-veneris]